MRFITTHTQPSAVKRESFTTGGCTLAAVLVWLCSAASTMLDAEHNFAPPVPGGIDVAMVASVKPRSKPAGDTTCKTDTRVWPRRKSNKLQWADVFCKLHTSYVSSIHTSCMAPRRGYDPWPLAHRLRLRMPHELPEPPVADPKWVAAQLHEGEPAESLQLYPSTPASRMRRAPWQRYKQSVTTYFDNRHWALVGTSCMYDIVTVLPVVTTLRSCNVNPHVCAETQLTHLFICEILRTHLFVVKSYETSLILILRRQRVDSQHVVTHHVQRYYFWGTCNKPPMAPTHDTYPTVTYRVDRPAHRGHER